MAEKTDFGGLVSRNAPKRARVPVADLTLIVRPPGRPGAIRAYTDSECSEADEYAAANGAVVDRLKPL